MSLDSVSPTKFFFLPFLLVRLQLPRCVSVKQQVGQDSDVDECQPLFRAAICAGI